MIELRTLGGLDVGGSHGETLGPLNAQPKRLALLTYLALADGSSFRRRDAVVAHLWPELDTAHARGSLRQALHFLRRSLGDGVILSRGEEEIAVNRALLWCDAVTFEANCEAGQCRDALHLYRGDFLDGFFVSDVAAEFDQWMAETRAHLRRRAAGCAWRESDESRAQGDITNAVSLARRAVALADGDESATARLISLLDGHGDRAGALEVYESLAARLRTDFGAEPSPETQALILRVRSRNAPSSVASDSVPPVPAEAEARSVSPPIAASARSPTRRRIRFFGTRPPASIGETADATRTSPQVHGSSPARRDRRSWFLFVGGPVLLLLGTGAWLVTRGPTLDPRRVLIGSFDDRTRDQPLAGLGRRAATEIVSGLASTGLVQPIDAATITPAADRAHDYPSLGPLARRVGAGSVVSGSLFRRSDSVEFQITLRDVATGELLRPIRPVVWPAADPPAAVALVAERVMAAYAAHFDPRFHNYVAISQPATYASYREFQTGIRLLNERRSLDSAQVAAVLDHFRRSAALDSTFLSARVQVATVQRWYLDKCHVADSLAATLRAAGYNLLSTDQASLDFARASCHGEDARAYAASQQIYRDAPDLAENVWVAAFGALEKHPREVLECLARLERTRDPSHDWRPDCWNLMTHAYHQLGQYRDALRSIDRMGAEYPDDPFLERYQMRQWAALGDVAKVNALIDKRLGKRSQEFLAGEDMMFIGEELRGHGHLAAGRALCERGVAWFGARPSSEQATHRFEVARLLYCAERWDQARVAYERLVSEDSSTTGTSWASAINYRIRLGALAARRGDSMEVVRIDRWFMARDSLPRASYGRAVLAGFRGDWGRAHALFQFAWDRGQPGFEEAHFDPVLEQLRGYPPIRALIYANR